MDKAVCVLNLPFLCGCVILLQQTVHMFLGYWQLVNSVYQYIWISVPVCVSMESKV